MLERSVIEKRCRRVWEKSLVGKCWIEVLERSVVERSVVEKFCREVL